MTLPVPHAVSPSAEKVLQLQEHTGASLELGLPRTPALGGEGEGQHTPLRFSDIQEHGQPCR